MNLKQIFAAMGLLATTALTGCSKDENSSNDTSLQILVTQTGIPVSGVSVTLYPSSSDFTDRTNPIITKTTGSNGTVTFNNLIPSNYYYYAEKGCSNNAISGYIRTFSPLIENTLNTASTSITQNGTIKFTNASVNPYKVYIDGTWEFDMNGGITKSITALAGNHTVRVLQISGYVLYPTDKTYEGLLLCGGTLNATFP